MSGGTARILSNAVSPISHFVSFSSRSDECRRRSDDSRSRETPRLVRSLSITGVNSIGSWPILTSISSSSVSDLPSRSLTIIGRLATIVHEIRLDCASSRADFRFTDYVVPLVGVSAHRTRRFLVWCSIATAFEQSAGDTPLTSAAIDSTADVDENHNGGLRCFCSSETPCLIKELQPEFSSRAIRSRARRTSRLKSAPQNPLSRLRFTGACGRGSEEAARPPSPGTTPVHSEGIPDKRGGRQCGRPGDRRFAPGAARP